MDIPRSSDRDAHFEAICTYLGSPVKSGRARAAILEEGVSIVSHHRPSEDMLFQALFIAENPEIADTIWSVHGAEAFRVLDFFSDNVMRGWRSIGLGPADTRRLFVYMRRAHSEIFAMEPIEALLLGLNSGSPEILADIREHSEPSQFEISQALRQMPDLMSVPAEMVEQVLDLTRACIGETSSWKIIVKNALQARKAIELAIYAKIGVDMTSFALDLKPSSSTLYSHFLDRCASNHGRLSLMRDLPDAEVLIKAPPAFVENMLRDMTIPPHQ